MNKDRFAKRAKTNWIRLIILVLLPCSLLLTPSCSPEAKWETNDVNIQMTVTNVSAGFAECEFSTDKEAYYLIAIQEAKPNYNPMEHQKQFMMLALDSANVEYLAWRNELLKNGEFNVAPFASHVLQYGKVDYFFTGLSQEKDYWIYAFVVNPETLQPCGKLHLVTITTKKESIMDVHFAYRIKGNWDYIYPMDSLGNICSRFPYIATTRDSLSLTEEDFYTDQEAVIYFYWWMLERFVDPSKAEVFYGVKAVANDGWSTTTEFEEGHTYYTAISGFDGGFEQSTVYKFTWTGDSCNYYFVETDSANIVHTVGNGQTEP